MKARIPLRLSKAQNKAMKTEINRQILQANEKYSDDIDALILYTLRVRFGFGKKRLRRFFDAFHEEFNRLVDYYELPDDCPFIYDTELKKIGVDISEWNRELKP